MPISKMESTTPSAEPHLKQHAHVGRGAMADVYKGLLVADGGDSRTVAIKRLREELRDSAQCVDLFVNEGKIAVQLRHPNVVHGLEVGKDDEGHYLVCEWLDGTTLDRIRATQPLSWQATAYVGLELCKALHYVHTLADSTQRPLDLVHRDVTPGNVFVSPDGAVKLGDFGVARCNQTHTADVKQAGTPEFSAPEQLNSKPVDARSDIYGLGKTLAALCDDAPGPLITVLSRATAHEPGDRYPNALELETALRQCARDLNAHPAATDLTTHPALSGTGSNEPAPQLDGALQSILGLGGPAPAIAPPEPVHPPPIQPSLLPKVVAVGLGLSLVGVMAWQLYPRTASSEPSVPPVTAMNTPPPDGPSIANNPSEAGTAEPPSAEPTQDAPTVAPTTDSTPKPAPKPIRRPPPPKPVALGTVSINAVPWAEVRVDGKKLGNTPLRSTSLPAGKHTFELVHPPDGTRHEVALEILPNKARTVVVDLRKKTIKVR